MSTDLDTLLLAPQIFHAAPSTDRASAILAAMPLADIVVRERELVLCGICFGLHRRPQFAPATPMARIKLGCANVRRIQLERADPLRQRPGWNDFAFAWWCMTGEQEPLESIRQAMTGIRGQQRAMTAEWMVGSLCERLPPFLAAWSAHGASLN